PDFCFRLRGFRSVRQASQSNRYLDGCLLHCVGIWRLLWSREFASNRFVMESTTIAVFVLVALFPHVRWHV
ncbi:MAG: hypothetical protein RIT00_435, partial [Actinomycetota bacterium]